MNPVLLILIFIVAAAAGFLIIRKVPPLLHTPLMSGMNALAGITVMGAIVAAASAVGTGNRILAWAAIILAMVNVVAGFGVTDRMLRMFKSRQTDKTAGES
jgi:NAD(P) transhydrogenase subunit alpha